LRNLNIKFSLHYNSLIYILHHTVLMYLRNYFYLFISISSVFIEVLLVLITIYMYIYIYVIIKAYIYKFIFNTRILLSKLPLDLKKRLISDYDNYLTNVIDDLNPFKLILLLKNILIKRGLRVA